MQYIIINIIIIIIIIYSIGFFQLSISWWFFTRVWVAASLLKSPGLFLVFWPISVKQYIIINIIIIFTRWQFFILALAGALSLEFEC